MSTSWNEHIKAAEKLVSGWEPYPNATVSEGLHQLTMVLLAIAHTELAKAKRIST